MNEREQEKKVFFKSVILTEICFIDLDVIVSFYDKVSMKVIFVFLILVFTIAEAYIMIDRILLFDS